MRIQNSSAGITYMFQNLSWIMRGFQECIPRIKCDCAVLTPFTSVTEFWWWKVLMNIPVQSDLHVCYQHDNHKKLLNTSARSNRGIVASNPTRGMDFCVRLFCICVLCVGSGLATGCTPVQCVLPTVYRLRNWKGGQGIINFDWIVVFYADEPEYMLCTSLRVRLCPYHLWLKFHSLLAHFGIAQSV
jgi:hypothetical protein